MIIKESVKKEVKEIIEKFNKEKFASKDFFISRNSKKLFLFIYKQIRGYRSYVPIKIQWQADKLGFRDFQIFIGNLY